MTSPTLVRTLRQITSPLPGKSQVRERTRNIVVKSSHVLSRLGKRGVHSSSSLPSLEYLEGFRAIVKSRTSGHRFSDREIEDGILRDVMALTQSAPSAFNIQPWSAVLVRDALPKERLSGAMLGGNAKKVMSAPLSTVFCADLEPTKRLPRMAELQRIEGVPEDQIAQDAMAMNLFIGEGLVGNMVRSTITCAASPLHPAPEVSPVEAWSYKNTALAAQLYMLACSAHGLATGPMEGFDARRVRAALDIPDRYGIPIIVATGYPTSDSSSNAREGESKRWRYPPNEVIFDNSFGVGMEGVNPVVP